MYIYQNFENSRIDIFYSAFHLNWNELPVKGLFIQFIHEILYSDNDLFRYNKFIGDNLSFNLNTQLILPEKWINYKQPNFSSFNIIPDNRIVSVYELKNIGIHDFYNNNNLIYSIAVNAHSDQFTSKLLSADEIEERIGKQCYFLDSNKNVSSFIIEVREGHEIWRYILWILCFMLIIEMLFANVRTET